ncbi:MAG: hypothetical protein CMH34_11605 [Microbacterium sp.]|nr:hypothetical protein [Microbacterium sp.]
MTTLAARSLAYDHIGARVSWTIPEPEALIENETPIGTLDWISHTQGAVVLGITFIEDAEDDTPAHRITLTEGRRLVITSDDYWLDPRTTITLHPDEPGA